MIRTELVNGDVVVVRLDRLPDRLREELRVGIGRAALQLARKVQKEKLSGQVLKVRTGRLRRSISDAVNESGWVVSGIVSSAVKYAPVHEYGFHGTVTVKEHLRQIKQAFGRPIEPKQIVVHSYSRQMNLPERSFLRSALREFEAAGIPMEEVNAAIARANA